MRVVKVLGMALAVGANLSILQAQSLTRAPHFSDWSAPVNMGAAINSPAEDQHPSVSKNGLSLYLSSNRFGGFGEFDI